MARGGPKSRTVSFFRLIKQNDDADSTLVRLPEVRWQNFLSKVSAMKLQDRTRTVDDRKLIGRARLVDGEYALVLMEPRDESSWLTLLNAAATNPDAETEEFNSGDGKELVETTMVVFLNFGNLIGIVKGSTASPSHTAIAEWLTAMKVVTKGAIKAQPALSSKTKEKMNAADGAASTTVRLSTSKAQALEKAGSAQLGGYLRQLESKYGELMVTVTYRVPRGKARDDARRELLEETERLTTVLGTETLKSDLVYIEGEKSRRQEEVDFVEQRISAVTYIATRDEAGNVIRDDSAIRSILSVASNLDRELRALE